MEQSSTDNTTAAPLLIASTDRTAVADHSQSVANPRETRHQLHIEKSAESVTSAGTKTPRIRVETRAGTHQYLFRRPRALQYFRDGEYTQAVRASESAEEETGPEQLWAERARRRVATGLIPLPKQREEVYVPVVQRRRLDIFIDLLWVGIIGTINDEFSKNAFAIKHNFGHSFLEFVILFMLAWQIWNYLRRFLNEYFLDDMPQRAFVVWILMLALTYGNNAPFLTEGYSGLVLGIFMVAKASFLLLEALYSNYFIPELRRLFHVNLILAMPAMGLYIAAIFLPWPTKAVPILVANLWETATSTIVASPLGDRLLRSHIKKAPDADHYVERLENFFVIILGNGVFILIQETPLGVGIHRQLGIGVLVLMTYFFLFTIYFSSDGSKHYVHAVRRAWWGYELWLTLHLIMYASVLLLEIALLTLVRKDGLPTGIPSESPESTTESSPVRREVAEDNIYAVTSAKWTASASLAIAVASMTVMALLNRSLDRKGTLMVSNRYLRMLPRAFLMLLMVLLPLKGEIPIFPYVMIMMCSLMAVAIWEWGAGLERGGGVFEPKDGE